MSCHIFSRLLPLEAIRGFLAHGCLYSSQSPNAWFTGITSGPFTLCRYIPFHPSFGCLAGLGNRYRLYYSICWYLSLERLRHLWRFPPFEWLDVCFTSWSLLMLVLISEGLKIHHITSDIPTYHFTQGLVHSVRASSSTFWVFLLLV